MNYTKHSHASLVKSYWEQGWAVAEDVFSPSEIDQLAHEAQAAASRRLEDLAKALNSPDEEVRRQAEHTKSLTVDGPDVQAPRKLEAPCQDTQCPSFRRVIADPRLVERVEAILGQPKPLLLLEQCFMKPPEVGSAKPFHQDNYFFEVDPTDAVVTAWLALDDATIPNGCLEYLSGSHVHGIQPHSSEGLDAPDGECEDQAQTLRQIDGEEWSSSKRVDSKATLKASGIPYVTAMSLPNTSLQPVPVRKGSVIFHHGSTIHRSGVNRTPQWRRAYSTHWAANVPSGPKKTTARSSILKDSVKLQLIRAAAEKDLLRAEEGDASRSRL